MEVSALEIIELSLLFAIPAAVVMVISYLVFVFITWIKQKHITLVFHWIDLVAPLLVTMIWCLLQTHSMQNKSLGNLAEISILGMVWGGLFAIRCSFNHRQKTPPVFKFLLLECFIAIFVALFAPTFSE